MRKPRSVLLRGSIVAAGGLLALTGCASGGAGSAAPNSSASSTDASAKVMDQAEWQKVVDAANKEGEITVYGALNTKIVEPMPAAFQKDFPNIKLTYVHLSPADMTARLDAEIASGNPGGDAIDNLDNPTFDGYANKGALMPLTVPALGDPAYDRKTYQRTPYVAAFGNVAYAFAWNTKLQPNGISSYQDYLNLDPAKLGATDPSISPSVVSVYQEMEKPDTGGSGFLDKLLAKGKPRIYAGSNPEVAALSAGEISAALPVPVGVVSTIKATGATIDYKFPSVASVIPGEMAIVKSAKHPNAAQVWLNWMLSKSGQTLLATGGVIPAVQGTPSDINTAGVKFVPIPQITTDQFKAFVQRWNQLLAK